MWAHCVPHWSGLSAHSVLLLPLEGRAPRRLATPLSAPRAASDASLSAQRATQVGAPRAALVRSLWCTACSFGAGQGVRWQEAVRACVGEGSGSAVSVKEASKAAVFLQSTRRDDRLELRASVYGEMSTAERGDDRSGTSREFVSGTLDRHADCTIE